MKIALVYPEKDQYGFAEQTHFLADALRNLPETQVETVPLLIGRQPTEYYLELGKRLNAPDIDVIHLPHEYSFYGSVLPKETGFWELRYLIKKPIVLSAYNLAPMESLLATSSPTLHQRLTNVLHFRSKTTRDAIEIAPFATAYTIVSTNYERKTLIGRGAKPEYVTVIPDGIPQPSDIADLWKTTAHEYRNDETEEDRGKRNEDSTQTAPDQYGEGGAVLMSDFSWKHRMALTYALAYSCRIMIVSTPETQEISSRRDCLELYDPGDDTEFERKWNEFTNNIQRQAALSAQARRYAERYSFPRIAVSTRRTYEAAISVF